MIGSFAAAFLRSFVAAFLRSFVAACSFVVLWLYIRVLAYLRTQLVRQFGTLVRFRVWEVQQPPECHVLHHNLLADSHDLMYALRRVPPCFCMPSHASAFIRKHTHSVVTPSHSRGHSRCLTFRSSNAGTTPAVELCILGICGNALLPPRKLRPPCLRCLFRTSGMLMSLPGSEEMVHLALILVYAASDASPSR